MIGLKAKNSLSISSLITFFRHIHNYFFHGESHNFYEVVFVLSGEVGITAGKNVFVLKAGEFTLHQPSEFHAIWEEGNSNPEIIVFSFSASSFPSVTDKIFTLTSEALEELKENFEYSRRIFGFRRNESFDHILPGMENEASIFTKKMEIFLSENLGKNARFDSSYPSQNSTLFANILSTMEKNISASLSVKEIARLCGVSIPTLEKTVYKFLGYGAITHYNILKLQRAHTMLISGTSIKETALSLGYLNQNYFSARFKKYFGYPPSSVKNINSEA